MTAIVFYASRTGNTRRVAEAIADGLRGRVEVDVRAIDAGPADVPDDAELVVIGGPTEAPGVTDEVGRFIEGLPHGCLRDRFAAAFDTRVRWPRWLSGSAAEGIRGRLEASGAAAGRQPELPGQHEAGSRAGRAVPCPRMGRRARLEPGSRCSRGGRGSLKRMSAGWPGNPPSSGTLPRRRASIGSSHG